MTAKPFHFSGVRAVALFEATKGILILLAGFGLLSLINQDVGSDAEWLVRHLHLNPASRYPRIFLESARKVTDTHLWLLAALAMIDSTVRCFAAYGLWFDREWGKWMGAVTAGIFIPLEIYEIVHHVTLLKIVLFLANLAIVIYLSYLLYTGRKTATVHSASTESAPIADRPKVMP